MAFLRLGIGDIRSAVKICGNSRVYYEGKGEYMAKHRSWHGADIKRARKKKLKIEKRKKQLV